ncbi:hypothetical protein Syncc9605_2248 [Synechococcus sp. CC9605]|nr:hypothetical protein Syncc9605_2248 [Synechococcus sp. CC9605]
MLQTMQKVLVIVTGQLRNCSDNISNWVDNLLHNCEYDFLFCIWDNVGNVDKFKIHECLRRTGKNYEASRVNTYLKKDRELRDELNIISQKVPIAEEIIHPFCEDYHTQIGTIAVPKSLIANERSWRSSLPLSYINQLAFNAVVDRYNKYDAYCRVQSEILFEERQYIDWEALSKKDNEILTSPSIKKNIDLKLDVSFYAGSLNSISGLMNTFEFLERCYESYENGELQVAPIGDRFLRIAANHRSLNVRHDVKMIRPRERLIPLFPEIKSDLMKINSGEINFVPVNRSLFDFLLTSEPIIDC